MDDALAGIDRTDDGFVSAASRAVLRANQFTEPDESLAEFFARSPHRDIDIDVKRSRDVARDVEL